MTDITNTEPKWEPYHMFHDKDGQHFYFQRYGCITHCYRLGPYLDYSYDYHCWWKVLPIPEVQMETLTAVPMDSEIEYQLKSLMQKKFPLAGEFQKQTGYDRHPRRNQWSELDVLEQKPKFWEKSKLIMSARGTRGREFKSAPFLHDKDSEPEVDLSHFVRLKSHPGSDDELEDSD